MHTSVLILIKKDNVQEALENIRWFLECEDSFFDSFTVNEESSLPLCNLAETERERLKLANAAQVAEEHLEKAAELKAKGFTSLAGFHYRTAGELYSGNLTGEMPFYNLSNGSYLYPRDESGWFAAAVDFHQ